ncbi:hypothetical protein [Vibrio alfacsensis]|uniref:hypothetical protein n=2 Tax=Vibrionaceae TaxID=641 RepID=UPI001C7F825D|nr:hypothetical protein [Vibrio alfacsensis]
MTTNAQLNSNRPESSIEQRLFKIADQMLLDGEKVTIRAILDKFPDISSTSTLSSAYTKWRQQQKQQRNSIECRLAFSGTFNAAIAVELSRLLDLEKSQLDDEQSDLLEQVALLQRELHHKEDLLNEAVETITDQKNELSNLRAESGLLTHQITDLKLQNQADLEELKTQQQQALDDQKRHYEGVVKQKQEDITKLETRNDTLAESAKENATLAAKHQVLEEQAINKLEAAEQAIEDLKEQLKEVPTLRSDLNVANALRESKEVEFTTLQERYETLQKSNTQLTSQVEVNRTKLEDYEQKTKELSEQSSRLNDARTQLATLSASERALTQEVTRLENIEQEASDLRGQLTATREQLTTAVNQVSKLSERIGLQASTKIGDSDKKD